MSTAYSQSRTSVACMPPPPVRTKWSRSMKRPYRSPLGCPVESTPTAWRTAPRRTRYMCQTSTGGPTRCLTFLRIRAATVQIDGEIGNTQYDDFSHHMFISAQSANQLVEVDPKTDTIVRRIPVPGAKENHGLLIDSASHWAFVACQGNDQLIVIDLRTGVMIAQFPVAKDPDVLAFDAPLQTLYVAGESGQVSEFKVSDGKITKTGESLLALNAHVVAIHPMTHEIYFPLKDVDGKPVLRIMRGGHE